MAKISEVIERLQYIMDIHGDLEMRKWCSGQGYESLVGEVIGISMHEGKYIGLSDEEYSDRCSASEQDTNEWWSIKSGEDGKPLNWKTDDLKS
jgi:hypothetical protein